MKQVKKICNQIATRIKQDLHCPHTMALSICAGIYIAFSPFIALHTVMVVLAAYTWQLNGPIMFIVSNAINNPWSLLVIYGIDYAFGALLFRLAGIDGAALNPAWLNALINYLKNYLHIPEFSFWAFMIGGNLLGILISVISYPYIYHALVRWDKKNKCTDHENYSAE